MKIQAATNFQNVSEKKPEDVPRFVDIFAQDVVQVVNGNIEPVSNIRCAFVPINFSEANTDVTVSHGLNKVPSACLPASLSTNMIIYSGSTANTANQITLKSSAVGSAVVLLL
jgi:hypothetical protein